MGKIDQALQKAKPKDQRPPSSPAGTAAPEPMATGSPPAAHAPVAPEPALSVAAPDPMQWEEHLRLATDPTSPAAENFRKLRTKILYSGSGPAPRRILITSAMPGEGKSFVCANLGIAIAQGLEQHAVVIDADLRRPSLNKLFGLTGRPSGLAEYLADDQAPFPALLPTGQQKLSLLPCGNPPPNPADLLSSRRMPELLFEMASRYPDRILLIDSPPAQAASETNVLANMVDGVLLVVRSRKAALPQVQQLIDTIDNEKILGLVFNAFEPNSLDSLLLKKGYYGYYVNEYGAAQPYK